MQRAVENLLHHQRRELSKKVPQIASCFIDIKHENKILPFLPIGTFRKHHVFQPEYSVRSFHSSASTNEISAKHSFSEQALKNYEINSTTNFKNFLHRFSLKDTVPILSLVPEQETWPNSSLAAMIAMFKGQGLNVHYLPPIDLQSEDFVIFGTSFHHILLAQDKEQFPFAELIKNKRVVVIDTGGTKGRTREYTLDEVHEIIKSTYKCAQSLEILSEYGMCELASQAWSHNSPHDGWFRCNDTLTPFIISLDKRESINTSEEVGFLAFIDEGNTDSYSAIITEDLAHLHTEHPRTFKLIGRSFDATIKGCSLNVKSHFQASSFDPSEIKTLTFKEKKPIESIESLLNDLKSDCWDACALADLKNTLEKIGTLKELKKTRFGHKMIMVLSANIPITFLYPSIIASLRGVSELHLKMPSLRLSDPFCERVRKQMSELARALAPYLAPMTIHLDDGRDFDFLQLKDFQSVLLFGSDETISQARLKCPEQDIIGLGTINNQLQVSKETNLEELAQLCSRWFGRGCLTPVALVGDELKASVFANVFENVFSERLLRAGFYNAFAHRHKILEFEIFFKEQDLDPLIFQSIHTAVIDLRSIPSEMLTNPDFPPVAGGCGLIFLLRLEQTKMLQLHEFPCEPGLNEHHMGQRWDEIIC